MDEIDHRLLLLVAEYDGAEHDFLGQLVALPIPPSGPRLPCRRRRGRACGRRELGLGGVQHVLIVDVADARRADGTRKRNPEERDCSAGSADHRGNVRIDLGIDRHHRRDDLHLVVEAVGKQRPNRTIDEPARSASLFPKDALRAGRSRRGSCQRRRSFPDSRRSAGKSLVPALAVVRLRRTVTSTTESPRLAMTAPPDWRAISPVSSVSV